MPRNCVFLILGTIIYLGPIGCSSKPPPRTEDPNASNLRRIGQAYLLCEDVKHHPPRNEAELVHWLSELGEVGPPEGFLISGRDGQPFVIFYGHKHSKSTPTEVVLAYEKDGSEGKRYVLTLAGFVRAMPDEEFARATFAEKKVVKKGA